MDRNNWRSSDQNFSLNERLTDQSYISFLSIQLNALLEEVSLDIVRRMWFMHDSAPSAYSTNLSAYSTNLSTD